MKTDKQREEIQKIEAFISDIYFSKSEGPIIVNSQEVHELAATGEFELRGGTNGTVGNRTKGVGLAYGLKKGLVIAKSQREADSIAKEIPVERLANHAAIAAGIIIFVSFV